MKLITKRKLKPSKGDFDGAEGDFILLQLAITCPECEAAITSRPAEAHSLYFDTEKLRQAVLHLIHSSQIKSKFGEGTVMFGNLRAGVEHVKCASCDLDIHLIWASSEIQPCRFRATLKAGLIDDD